MDIVKFETAKLAKSKGFDESTEGYYYPEAYNDRILFDEFKNINHTFYDELPKDKRADSYKWNSHVNKSQKLNILNRIKNNELQEKISRISVQSDKEVEELYKNFVDLTVKNKKGIKRRLGPTATSKFLHILRPDYFTMWDRPIRMIFFNKSDPHDDFFFEGQSYFIYSKFLREDVKRKIETVSKKGKKLWSEINEIFDYRTIDNYRIIKKPLKLIDEFLWIRFTREYYRLEKKDSKIKVNDEVLSKILNESSQIEPKDKLLKLINP